MPLIPWSDQYSLMIDSIDNQHKKLVGFINQLHEAMMEDKIIATPTLVKELPPPLRKVIGDLSERDKVLLGLDLVAKSSKEVEE